MEAQEAAAEISIHALLAESDDKVGRWITPGIAISIHALLAESDNADGRSAGSGHKFLSTLSLRRATHAHRVSADRLEFLSTLSLRRATD